MKFTLAIMCIIASWTLFVIGLTEGNLTFMYGTLIAFVASLLLLVHYKQPDFH